MTDLNHTSEIPTKLLQAAQDREKYFELHAEYMEKYCCKYYRDAWQFLEEDLSRHGLPCRYSTYDSFKDGKRKNYNSKKAKLT